MGINAACGPGGTELSGSRPLQAPLTVDNFLLAFQGCCPEPAARQGPWLPVSEATSPLTNPGFSALLLSPSGCVLLQDGPLDVSPKPGDRKCTLEDTVRPLPGLPTPPMC